METIIAALFAGATAATKDAAGTAVKDAYEGLKKLIKRKFEGDPIGQGLVDAEAEKIKKGEELLKDSIKNASVDQDEEIIKKAEELLEQLKPEESAPGKVNINVGRDFEGFAGENVGTVTQTFNKK